MKNEFSFANRCNWDLASNEVTALYHQLKENQIDVIDLTESNPTRCGFGYPNEKIIEALSDPSNLTYKPDAQGLLSARSAVAQIYESKGIAVNPNNIFLTASTSEAYSYIFRLLGNPGDTVLFPSPSYPLFQFLGELNDLTLSFYPLVYTERWQIDFTRFVEELNNNVKAIVVVNPNNPTGSYVSPEELQHLNKLCASRQMALISDEVFYDFSLQADAHVSLADNKTTLTFVLGGLSKMIGLPQMKISWIIMNGPENLVAQARSRLEVVADTYLSVNTPAMNALPAWLSIKDEVQDEIKRRVNDNYQFLVSQTESLRASTLLNAQGGWYAVLKLNTKKTEEQWVMKLLNKYHVFVHPGFFYDFADGSYLVISLLPEKGAFQEGILRILSRIEQEEG